MSLASRSWWLSSGLLGNLGVLGHRRLGSPSPAIGLSSPICFSASSLSCAASSSQLLYQLSVGPCSFCCGDRPPRQGRHRTCVLGSGILQLAFCDTQSHWRLETCDGPLPSQPLRSPHPVSHGNFGFRPPVAPPRRLDGIIRSSGCLPPGPCPSGLSEVSQVLHGSRRFSIQGSLLWSFLGASGFHPGHGSGLLLYAPLRIQDPSLLRRLASSRILVSGDYTGEGLSPTVMRSFGYSDKSCEEYPHSFSTPGLSRHDTPVIPIYGLFHRRLV